MTGKMKHLHFDAVPQYKPGDPRPEGYMQWHEWARIQHRAGLRQRRCPVCLRWRFPQEICCHEERPAYQRTAAGAGHADCPRFHRRRLPPCLPQAGRPQRGTRSER